MSLNKRTNTNNLTGLTAGTKQVPCIRAYTVTAKLCNSSELKWISGSDQKQQRTYLDGQWSALSGNICVVETRTQHLQHLKPVLLRRDWQLKILLPLGGYQSSCLEECIQQLYAEFCEKPSQRARRVISVMSKKWSMLRNHQKPTESNFAGFIWIH